MRHVLGLTLDAAHAFIGGHRPAVDEPTGDELLACAAAILRPPGGRLSRYVLSRVADDFGCTVEALEAAAFPPSPMRAAR